MVQIGILVRVEDPGCHIAIHEFENDLRNWRINGLSIGSMTYTWFQVQAIVQDRLRKMHAVLVKE
jgi:hypothetical protein